MGKCKFRNDMLQKTDENGYLVSEWGRKHDDEHIYCIVCTKPFSITAGANEVLKHARGEGHKAKCVTKLSKSQLRLTAVRPGSTATASNAVLPGEVAVQPAAVESVAAAAAPVSTAASAATVHRTLQVYSPRDKTTMAELRWVMECVVKNMSAKSCEGKGDLFASMFGEDRVGDFSISATKFRYLVTDALGPYFRNELLADMAGAYYSLSFDETSNNANAKELQDVVTYWSNSRELVVSHHLQTFYIGSATAEILVQHHNEALDNANLPRSKLLMLGRDGPNVNKKVQRLMSEQIMEIRGRPLLDIGSCNIHILHNGFEKGLGVLGDDASELIIKVHEFFGDWALRVEDFRAIQDEFNLPHHSFIKHVKSRWLTLEGAAERLLEQWKSARKYFLKFIPRSRSNLLKSKAYQRICELLKRDSMKSELMFVCYSARVFTRFTGAFQVWIKIIYHSTENTKI